MRPPDSWSRARVTLVLTIATAAAWLVVAMLRLDPWAIDAGAFVPARVPPGPDPGLVPWWLTPLTAAFVHGGLIHLAFNLLILVFCGRPTEAVVGPLGIVILYVVGAYAAAGAQYLLDPGSIVPMIGASGAISAVLGAYAILFGRNRVKVASPTLALWLNALWLMAAWIVLQVIVGYTSASFNVGIAFAAHIGGFIVGVALANPLLLIRYRRA
ncbi:MAG: rhomboid family intramembrane serine protease [Allosphingosinicella sp.]